MTTISRKLIATTYRVIREERGDMQFLYASLAVFAALAVAAGEGLAESAGTWLNFLRVFIGS